MTETFYDADPWRISEHRRAMKIPLSLIEVEINGEILAPEELSRIMSVEEQSEPLL